MDRAYDTFHDVLVNLFNEIMDVEEKAIITPEFHDITNNDMHVIEAVGDRKTAEYVRGGQDSVRDGGDTDHSHE